MNNIIPIFFATNNDYCAYLAVTLQSIKEHISNDAIYDIYILYNKIDTNKIKLVEKMADDNFKITFMDVSESLEGKHYYGGPAASTKHISEETFYRMLIAQMMPQFDKVLYLDCDIVVLDDLKKLYEMDIQDKTLGAVYSVEFWNDEGSGTLPSNEEHEWFNAGILIIDLNRYRKMNIAKKCDDIMSTQIFTTVDQDVLRLACYKDVTYLPYEWNVMWHHLHNGGGGITVVNAKAYKNAVEKPRIIHYSSGIKPWKLPEAELADFFWKYARRTDFYEEILFKNLQTSFANDNPFEDYVFPFDLVEKNESVILYGAGKVGKSFAQQIELTRWCQRVLWVDKNYKDDKLKGLGLENPELVKRIPFDKIIICIEKESVAKIIKEMLLGWGIQEEKIVFTNYFKE